MTNHPFSTKARVIQKVDALAQCEKCLQTSSYDTVDAYEGRLLECTSGEAPNRCGGRLKLYGQVPNLGQVA